MNDLDIGKVRVELAEHAYDIHLDVGLLDDVGARLRDLRAVSHAVLITDLNVQQYADRVAESLAWHGTKTEVLRIEPGEPSKSINHAATIWEELLGLGTDRKSLVIAVGGGVVGDLAGFVAATYARGLDYVQVPTTLLAQVDSSVGGKTGVNLSAAKNMVGSFWQPLAVFIDTQVLHTLPAREYAAGLAEVVKYGVIQDADFFTYLEEHIEPIRSRDDTVLRRVIARCCQLKAQVVEADERETTGQRAILNYGHTFAHALEAGQGYGTLLHGEAVAIGMLCASRLAESLGRIAPDVTKRQSDLLVAFDLPIRVPDVDPTALIELMQHDKKVEHGLLRFILPDRLGHVELVSDVPLELVHAALSDESAGQA